MRRLCIVPSDHRIPIAHCPHGLALIYDVAARDPVPILIPQHGDPPRLLADGDALNSSVNLVFPARLVWIDDEEGTEEPA